MATMHSTDNTTRETDALLHPCHVELSPHSVSPNCNHKEIPNDAEVEEGIKRGFGRTFLRSGEINVRTSPMTWKMKTGTCISALVLIYVGIIIFYGIIWTVLSISFPDCNIGIENILEGCLFSLESIATIGYSTQSGDIFFGDCKLAGLTLLAEICTKIFIDALIIGTIYVRMASPSLRGGGFISSDFAVMRRVNSKLYFMCQFVDTSRHHLLSANVRLYAMYQRDREDDVASPFIYRQLKLVCPQFDDTPLLMFFPQLIVHEIDEESALWPPNEYIQKRIHQSTEVGNKSSVDDGLSTQQRIENKLVQCYLKEKKFEIFGLLDGLDAISGVPTQRRFSYCFGKNEVQWNKAYVSCVSSDDESGAPYVDFNSFQSTVDCPGNIDFAHDRLVPDVFEGMV